MPTPGSYFDNRREGDLADRIWTISATLPGSWKLNESHEIFANAEWPWMSRRIIYARDWITFQRERDGQGGVRSVNSALGGTDFTAEEIGNVEHFYVSALLGTLGGPAGGIMLSMAGSAAWEMVVGPVRIAWNNRSPAVVWKNMKHNWNQLLGPDLNGARFGSLYTIVNPIEKALGIPTENDPRPPQNNSEILQTHQVSKGDSLSRIAEKWYQEMALWPVIYDENRATIGPDYNKIKPGQVLRIPNRRSLTSKQLEDARKRHRNWRPS